MICVHEVIQELGVEELKEVMVVMEEEMGEFELIVVVEELG